MNSITLTQIVKTKPEETKPLVVDIDTISVSHSLKNGTRIVKHLPVRREYVVKETKDQINDMIEHAYAQDIPPQYDYNKDLSILIKVTDDKALEIKYKSDEYDYNYYTNNFLVIVKDNIIIREISINKIIDVCYNNKENE